MDQQTAELLRRHLEAENRQDMQATLDTLHPDCHFEDLATGQTWRGRDGAAAHYRQWWTTFDVTVKREAGQFAGWTTDGACLTEATWHGRHVGPFLGIPATGRIIAQPFVVTLTMRDGLLYSERFQYDLTSLLRQISTDPIPSLHAMPYRAAA